MQDAWCARPSRSNVGKASGGQKVDEDCASALTRTTPRSWSAPSATGGRDVRQLRDREDLLVARKLEPREEPEDVEVALISQLIGRPESDRSLLEGREDSPPDSASDAPNLTSPAL